MESGYSFNGPIWSISLEVLAYALFFVLLRYIGKSIWVNVGIVGLCLFAKAVGLSSLVVNCLLFFYAGGVSAIALMYFEGTKYEASLKKLAVLGVLLGIIVADGAAVLSHRTSATLFLLVWVPMLLFASAGRVSVAPVIRKTIEAAGNMTYSSYLLHFPIQLGFSLYFTLLDQPIPYLSTAFFALYFTSTLAASYFVYKRFEMPSQTLLRSYFNAGPSKQSALRA